jgi:hypothetical protein
LKYAKPALLIWQHEIFRSDFYKAFEERLLQIPIEQHMPLGQEIERVLPQLTHVMSSGFNFFGTQIRTIQNDISTINTNMKSINDTIVQSSERQTSQLTYNFRQCLGGILLNSARELLSSSSESPSQDILQNEVPPIPSQVTSTQGNQLPEAESPLALLPPPNAAPSFRQPVAAGASSVMTSIPCVPYKLNRSFHSVVDVWSEYVDGYAGYPPVEKLEELYQTGWRKNPNDSRYFLRRKVIYDEIKNIASQNNSNTMDQNRKLKQAAADLEAYRVEKGLKLDKLMKEITSRNKDKNN